MENQIPVISKVDGQQTTVTHTKPNNLLVILLLILLVISVVILGFFVYQTQKLTKQLSIYKNVSSLTPTPTTTFDPNHGYKLFKELFIDSKYNFSFNLPDYFGRYGGWSSDNEWEKDANPDYLYILPFETAKQEDAVFTGRDELSGRVKELSILISKGN